MVRREPTRAPPGSFLLLLIQKRGEMESDARGVFFALAGDGFCVAEWGIGFFQESEK